VAAALANYTKERLDDCSKLSASQAGPVTSNPLPTRALSSNLGPKRIGAFTMSGMTEELQRLDHRPKCKDWGALVQRLCEETWRALASDEQVNINDADTRAFTELLRVDSDAFALARLIIPQLRSRSPDGGANDELLGIRQRSLLADLEPARGIANRTRHTTQESFDHPLYRAEKDIVQDERLHRVRVLLQHSGRFNDVAEEEITAWLDKAPAG
jgi:hypothetical protein